MKILVYSDLHLESQGFQPKKEWLEGVDVVVQTGDVNYGTSPLRWLAALNKRAFFVPGNHEYWNPVKSAPSRAMIYAWGGGSGWDAYKVVEKHPADVLDRQFIAQPNERISVLQNSVVVHEGVRFIGTTLWFNPDGEGACVASMMNDFKRIRSSTGKPWTVSDVRQRHAESVGFLVDALEEPFDGKTVVLTHHAPSLLSTEDRGGSPSDFLYGTNLEHLVSKADLWVHGHVHQKNDYKIGKCRVISNPRGHPSDSCRKTFNKNLIVEV